MEVVSSICEHGSKLEASLSIDSEDLRSLHLERRKVSEEDFFKVFCDRIPDNSNAHVIERGEVDNEEIVSKIIGLNPDLLISYGCSIIKSRLLDFFKGRFINIHLGLSPYYRGSGTNFWPLVNNELEFVGVTFMYIDRGIDTGEIIHQVRARIFEGDTPHQIGNRLIKDSFEVLEQLVTNFEKLEKIPPSFFSSETYKFYRNRDFTEEAVSKVYQNFENGAVLKYLSERYERCMKSPIFENPILVKE